MKISIKKYEIAVPWFSLLIAAVAYVFYGLKAAVITGLLSYLSLGILPLLGIIPVAGPFLYIMAFNWLKTGLLSLDPALQSNFLMEVVFWIGLLFATVFTIVIGFVVGLLILGALADRKGW